MTIPDESLKAAIWNAHDLLMDWGSFARCGSRKDIILEDRDTFVEVIALAEKLGASESLLFEAREALEQLDAMIKEHGLWRSVGGAA